MGISIVKKTAGNVILTKRVTKVLNEWQLDFNSAMKITSGHTKQLATQERDFLRKILKLKKLNRIDVFELFCIVDKNISILNSLNANLDIIALSSKVTNLTDSGIRIGLEALVIKKFIDKHFHLELTH